MGVAHADQMGRVHQHEAERALQVRQHLEQRGLQLPAVAALGRGRDGAGQQLGHEVAVAGDRAGQCPRLPHERRRVGEVAVVAEGELGVAHAAVHGLGVAPDAGAGGRVAGVADAQVALERGEGALVEHGADLAATRYRRSFDPGQRFVAWLYGIARHTALTEARRSHRRELSLDHLSAADRETAAENERGRGFGDGLIQELALREQVRQALQELPPEQRACLILREYEQRSYQEIAVILACTPENARVLAFRARRALRVLLKSYWQGEESCV